MSRIKFKPRRITIAGQVPTIDQLENGEFAINTADQKIFQRVGSSVVEVSNVGVVQGTTNEIEVSTVGSTSTIGLPNDVTITGDLTVNGTTTTISTTNTVISDNLLELNSGASSNANDSGIIIERGSTGDNAIIFWDESADVFRLATTTATAASTGNLSTTDANLNVGGLTTSGNIVIPDAGTIGSASDTDAISISSGGVVTLSQTLSGAAGTFSGILKTDDTTDATSTTDGSLQTDGGLSVAKDVVAGDDVKLLSDAAVLAFGADGDVTLTHVADTGLLLNGTRQLQFNDASQNITAPSGTVLDINATDEVELNATLVDVNANLDVSGTYTGGGLMTTGGNIVIPDAGTIGSASATNAITIASTGIVTFVDDIILKDNGTIGVVGQGVPGAISIANDGVVSFVDDIKIKDGGTIGSASDADAISISSGGDVTLTQDLKLQHDGSILSFGASDGVKLTHIDVPGFTGLNLTDSAGTPTIFFTTTDESISSDGTNLILKSGGTNFKIPTSDGTSGQALVTDASGNLSFSTVTAASPLSITSASGGQINLGSTDSSITATDLIGEIVNVTGETDSGVSPAARIQIRAQQDHSSSTNESSIVFQVGRPALSNATTPAFYGFAMRKADAAPTSSGQTYRGGSVTTQLQASPEGGSSSAIFGGSSSIKSTSGGFGFGAPEWFLGINYYNDPSDDPDGSPTQRADIYVLADDDAEAEALTSGNFTVSANDGTPSETFTSEPSNYIISSGLTAAYQKTYGSTKSVFFVNANPSAVESNIFNFDNPGRGVDTSAPSQGVKAQFTGVDRTAGLDDAMYVHRSHFDTPMVTVPNITVNKLLEMNPGSAIGLRNYCNPSDPSDFDGYGELPFPAIEFGADVSGMGTLENNIVIQSTTANGVVFNAHGATASPAITFASQHVKKAQIFYDIGDSRLETSPSTNFHITGTLTLGPNSSPDDSISSDNSNLILTSGGTSFKIPTSDGTSGQALVTDASGNLSFSTVGAASPLSITSASGGQINLGTTDSSVEDGDLIGEIVGVTGETGTDVSPTAKILIRAQQNHSTSTNESAIVFQVGRPALTNATTPAFHGFSMTHGSVDQSPALSGGIVGTGISPDATIYNAEQAAGASTRGGFGYGAPEWFLGLSHTHEDNPPDEGDETDVRVFVIAEDDAEAEALTSGNMIASTNDGSSISFNLSTTPSNYFNDLLTFTPKYQETYGSNKVIFGATLDPAAGNLANLLKGSPSSPGSGSDQSRGVDETVSEGVKFQFTGVDRTAGLDDAMYVHRSHFDTPMVTVPNMTVNKLLEMAPGSAIGLRDHNTSAPSSFDGHGEFPFPAIEFGSFIAGTPSGALTRHIVFHSDDQGGVVLNAHGASKDPVLTFASQHSKDSILFYDRSDSRLETDTAFHVGGALSKSSGTFEIDHPLESLSDTRRLQHSFIEGPYTDLIYRGSNTLSSGTASINIDTEFNMTEGTFEALNTNIQCFTTNESDWDAVKGSVSGNTLTITCQNSSSTATVSWMVIGYRKDEAILNSELTDSAGKFITEKYKYPVLIQESGDYILNEENGKVLLNDRAI